jgi:hypothetical protein
MINLCKDQYGVHGTILTVLGHAEVELGRLLDNVSQIVHPDKLLSKSMDNFVIHKPVHHTITNHGGGVNNQPYHETIKR